MLGWISLHRKLQEHEIYADPYMLKLWIHCLLKASHKERNQLVGNQVVNLEVGQFITGRKALANEFNKGAKDTHIISESTLWRWMLLFEQLQMLNIKKTTKYSVITVVNWCEYQGIEQQMNSKWTADEQQMNSSRTTDEQQVNNKRTANEQQMNTNNNVNNFNNVNHDNNLNNDNNDNNDNYENNANKRERPTDKDLKDSFNASSVSNSVEKEEKKKEKTVVGRSLSRNEQIVSIEKAIQFTFDNVDDQVYKEIPGWLAYSDYDSIMTVLQETAQLEEIPNKFSSHILNMLIERKKQGPTAMSG
ncbi:hypothetical protein [Bacillus sp. RS11]|uniref:hypothetical protein n=1 Tax=Lysinibacillus sp. RS11 TaxID=3242682 RepID=UPI0035C7030D